MNVHISRQGQRFGPYPVTQLEEMLRAGNIVPTDLVWPDGATEWIPLGNYLESLKPKSSLSLSKSAAPPALPSGTPPVMDAPPVLDDFAPSATGQVLLGGKIISGTRGMSAADVEREVQAGGRFVMYQYCFSVLVMTFKRPSDIIFLRGNEDGFSHTLRYSLISLFVGWWGIPWGPIWTITTLVSNAGGGKDLTLEVLSDILGPARATAVCARRGRPAPASTMMKLFRVALVAVPVLFIALIAYAVYNVDTGERSERTSVVTPAGPGAAEFETANRPLNINHGTVAFGNSTKAQEVAAQFSKAMKARREAEFTAGKKGAISMSKGEFLTHCELRDDRCVILVHVPELRRYQSEAKETMAYLAWETAQSVLKEKGVGKDKMSLVVGVRGVLLYDRVMVGKYVDDPKQLESSIKETETESGGKALLHFWFKPAAESNAPPR